MIQIIALTQFVFLALGSMAVTVLVKASGNPTDPGRDFPMLSLFLMRYSVWLMLVPVIWCAYALLSARIQKGVFKNAVAQGVGIGLTAAIFLAYALAVFGHF